MRVKMRTIIDPVSNVVLGELSPWNKIMVGIQKKWMESDYYKRKKEKELESEYREKVRREELLKEELYTRIYGELIANNKLKSKGLECKKVVLLVDRSMQKELMEIVKHKDFIDYKIRINETTEDMLLSFPKLPIKVEVSLKILGGEANASQKANSTYISNTIN